MKGQIKYLVSCILILIVCSFISSLCKRPSARLLPTKQWRILIERRRMSSQAYSAHPQTTRRGICWLFTILPLWLVFVNENGVHYLVVMHSHDDDVMYSPFPWFACLLQIISSSFINSAHRYVTWLFHACCSHAHMYMYLPCLRSQAASHAVSST